MCFIISVFSDRSMLSRFNDKCYKFYGRCLIPSANGVILSPKELLPRFKSKLSKFLGSYFMHSPKNYIDLTSFRGNYCEINPELNAVNWVDIS